MKVFLQILTAGYELGLLPLAVGGMLTFLRKKQIGPFSYLLGYLVVFACFLTMTVPLLCLHTPLPAIVTAWRAASVGVAVLFLIFLAINRKELGQWFKKFLERVRHWDVMRSFFIVICVVVTLIAVVWVMPSKEDDTAETAAIMDATGTAYEYEPYTLNPVTAYPNKNVFSPLEVFYVVNARMAGVNTTQFIHVFLPFFLLPLVFVTYWQMGEYFWQGCVEKKELFVLLVIVFYSAAAYSSRSLMVGAIQNVWNGTSLAAAWVFPAAMTAVFSLMDAVGKEKKKVAEQILFLLLCYAAGQLLLPEAFIVTTAIILCGIAGKITERCLRRGKYN